MYIPKYCPECGENRQLFIETKPYHLSCQKCGMEFEVRVTFDVDEVTASCDNCGTKAETGCSFYTAKDCGPSFSLWKPKPSCYNKSIAT